MPVDPILAPLLETLPPLQDPIDDFDAWRAQGTEAAEVMITQLAEPGPEVGNIEQISLPVGAASIDLRIYQHAAEGPHPAHLFLHGGGWIAGAIHDTYIDIVRRKPCAGTYGSDSRSGLSV